MSNQTEKRNSYLSSFFKYDHDFNLNYDRHIRNQRQYVDLQPSVDARSGRLLALLIRLIRAERVLELGTSIGYSAHWMATALEETGGHLVTVDSHPRTAVEAREQFEKSGLAGRIEFINRDVMEVLPELKPGFDLIFMDCAKGLYPQLTDHYHRLLRPGGLLAVDDTLFPVEEGVRQGLAKKVDQFNHQIAEDPRFYDCMLDIGHGLTLAVRDDS